MLACFFISLSAQAAPNDLEDNPSSLTFRTTAQSHLLIDAATGVVLAQKNADHPIKPADFTKLMTSYLVFEALYKNQIQLNQTLIVSNRARNMSGSRMFLEESAQVLVEDLIKGMIVQSGNDATIVLAEGVGGTVDNFVMLMNQKAKQLGMHDTYFINPEGSITDGQTTTAYDLAILSIHLIKDFPNEYKYFSLKEFSYPAGRLTQPNRNQLLRTDPTVDGLLTAYSETEGYSLIASSLREQRLLSIVVGTSMPTPRFDESQQLLNWGFENLASLKNQSSESLRLVIRAPLLKLR